MSLTAEQIERFRRNATIDTVEEWHELCDMAVKSLTKRTDQRPDVGVAGVLAADQPMSGHPNRAEEMAVRIRFDYAISIGAKEAIKQAILKACAEQRESDAKIAVEYVVHAAAAIREGK